MNTSFRCPGCREIVEPERQGDFLVAICCDEVVEKVFWCETCEEREQHSGCEQCIECVADEFIAAPDKFIGTAALKAEIADELAKRLRPFLRQRQAA